MKKNWNKIKFNKKLNNIFFVIHLKKKIYIYIYIYIEIEIKKMTNEK